ncbi:hypothetical protein LCGC14_2219990 [marine sediment metagenome]|uniref:Uncharacterized protein n=1 Tax=marine sediment metagenome TaxID=412755 RepID=A0A0F9FNU9_9ZZZZ
MAQHDPVEDALNERKRQARLVEAGGAFSSPVNPEALDITRQFLGGELPPRRLDGGNIRRLPPQASPVARSRAFGQQGTRRRRDGGDLISPLLIGPYAPYIPPTDVAPDRTGSLAENFLNLPGPVGFAQTPQGRAILQRILSLRGTR